MLIIEVTEQDVITETRIIPPRGKVTEPRTVYDQPCLLRMGGRTVVEHVLSHDNPNLRLEAGLYVLDGSSYKMNDFGSPELKRAYQQSLMPLAQALAPYKSSLSSLLKN